MKLRKLLYSPSNVISTNEALSRHTVSSLGFEMFENSYGFLLEGVDLVNLNECPLFLTDLCSVL